MSQQLPPTTAISTPVTLSSPAALWCSPCNPAVTPLKRVAYVLTLLTGRAHKWGVSMWEAKWSCIVSFDRFRGEMMRLFNRSVRGDEAAAQLSRLSQGRDKLQHSVLDPCCGWNEAALQAWFLEDLNNAIADTHAGSRNNATRSLPPLSAREVATPLARTMFILWQGGSSSLCMSSKSYRSSVDSGWALSSFLPSHSAPCSPVTSFMRETGIQAFLDSEAEGKFPNPATARRWRIPAIQLPVPLSVLFLSGRPISTITHVMPHISLYLSGNNCERIRLYILDSPNTPITLGTSISRNP